MGGTPPHAWGKLITSFCIVDDARYTPTCVGKTASPSNYPAPDKVHPHMRGENLIEQSEISFIDGTPPHAWGKRLRSIHIAALYPVHPHMRGENHLSQPSS